jgi:hypothetical protein
MKLLKTTNGISIQVSDADFDYLSLFNWHAMERTVIRRVYDENISIASEILHLHNVSFKGEVDHKDRNVLNNQFENLRPATSSQNKANRKRFTNNTSGYIGVSFHCRRSKYRAYLQIRGMNRHLGYFENPEVAAKVRDRAATFYFGEFAVLNFPEEESCQNETQ